MGFAHRLGLHAARHRELDDRGVDSASARASLQEDAVRITVHEGRACRQDVESPVQAHDLEALASHLRAVTAHVPSMPIGLLDIETTGDGFAAPQVGIVGFGVITGRTLQIHQLTLLRPEGEPVLLEAWCELMGRIDPAVLLTFNGASFDLPVLRQRLRRLGLDARCLERPHVDLLVPSRRLWAAELPDCRLHTLEEKILGRRRVGDPDGAEVARILGRVLAGASDPATRSDLDRAEAHNRRDLWSMVDLVVALSEQVRRPSTPARAIRVARHLRRLGRIEDALEALRAWVERVEAGAESATPEAVATMLEAAHACCGLGRRDEAVRLWRWVCTHAPGHPEAHEALAKHLEHRERAYAEAWRVAAGSSRPCPRRLARLRHRLERAAALERSTTRERVEPWSGDRPAFRERLLRMPGV